MAGRLADHLAEHGVEHGTLALAPDEGRVEAARKAGGVGEDVYHGEGVDRLAVLERARPARLDDDRVAYQPMRRLPDQDLVRRRRLLEALGDVDGLSGDEQMPLRVVAGDHLAGVDADPVASRTPQPASSSRLRMASASRISTAARTARRASSS